MFTGAALSGDQHPVFGVGYNGSDNIVSFVTWCQNAIWIVPLILTHGLWVHSAEKAASTENNIVISLIIKDFKRQECPQWSLLCCLLLSSGYWKFKGECPGQATVTRVGGVVN